MPTMSISLVTGGTGYIGLYVVKELLEHGHIVHTTVRSLKNKHKCKPLLDLQVAHPGKLRLFEADLLVQGSFKEAMHDCDTVYHIASPFILPQQTKDGMKEIVEPALKGTQNVLDEVNETQSVRRVVLTSSLVSMYCDSSEVYALPKHTLTESVWNITASPTYNPYGYSKAESERLAWRVTNAQSEVRWDLVATCPGLVLGPPLSSASDSGSLRMLEHMYEGSDRYGIPNYSYAIVDVRDLAVAHVAAGEKAEANGRYIVSHARSTSMLAMAELVRPFHKQARVLPTRAMPKLLVYLAAPFLNVSKRWADGNLGIDFDLDNKRSKEELHVVYRPLEHTFRDHYLSYLARQDVN
ncbi:NAD(P)-binding protein [Trichoderma camerunense]